MNDETDWIHEEPVIPHLGLYYRVPSGPQMDFEDIDTESDSEITEVSDVVSPAIFWNFSTSCPELGGYVYMNGDIGKLPSGVVYNTAPESLGPSLGSGVSGEYSAINGSPEGQECFLETSDGSSPPVSGSDATTMPIEQLKQMLSTQLEYYFSRENLVNDAYLISQMDNDQYVPIWTVANFNQVKRLTKDLKLITEVLRESPNVQVDDEGLKVRPNHKRCIVILREISDNTPLEEVKNLFSGENCPRLISCEFAHNNSWYVTFESDDDAQKAYKFLREEVREFQGKPIMARIKAKPMNRLPVLPTTAPSVNVPTMKNGYQHGTPPPPPPGVFDPNTAAYQPSQQRFLYTNGSSVTPTAIPYGQMHVYPAYQHNPSFFPSMLTQWGTPTYFDIGSMFPVNGIAPQQAAFGKPPGSGNRYGSSNQRNNRSKRGGASGGLNDASSHVLSRPPLQSSLQQGATVPTKSFSGNGNKYSTNVEWSHTHKGFRDERISNNIQNYTHAAYISPITTTGTLNQIIDSDPNSSAMRSDSDDNSYRSLVGKDQPLPPRHRRRRKEEETLGVRVTNNTGLPISNTSNIKTGAILSSNATTQFDLEASAFPPLPGLEDPGHATPINNSPASAVVHRSDAAVVSVIHPTTETIMNESNAHDQLIQGSNHWGESRLADVVKGTVRPKSSKESHHSSIDAASPRSVSPGPVNNVINQHLDDPPPELSSVALTPPCTPDNAPIERNSHNLVSTIMTSIANISISNPIKSTMTTADKSTRTDDALLSSSTSSLPTEPTSTHTVQTCTTSPPTTTNAATMTTGNNIVATKQITQISVREGRSPSPPILELNPARLSYAQVAQHHKERLLREKQQNEAAAAAVALQITDNQLEKERRKDTSNASSATIPVEARDNREGQQQQQGQVQQQFRDNSARYGPTRNSGGRYRNDALGQNQGSSGQSQRRNTRPQLREFFGPRSPK